MFSILNKLEKANWKNKPEEATATGCMNGLHMHTKKKKSEELFQGSPEGKLYQCCPRAMLKKYKYCIRVQNVFLKPYLAIAVCHSAVFYDLL